MNELQIFKNPEFGEIRTVEVNNEPWFVGKDVASVLGYANPRDALAKRVDADDKGVANCDTLGGEQNMTIINESGLYSLILSSKLHTAKKFKHWVTSEVLPTIRKHGAYMTPETLQEAIIENRCSIWRKSQQQAHTPVFLSPWSVKTMGTNYF